MNNAQIKLGIAEDHLVFRQGLISLFKEIQNIQVIFDVANGRELLDEIPACKPDVILLDIDMPVMGGHEALLEIRQRYSDIKVIMLTSHFIPGFINEFLKDGASAFLPKGTGIEKIAEAIDCVHKNGYYYDEAVLKVIEMFAKSEDEEKFKLNSAALTDRELEILKLIREGKTNTEIGIELCIGNRTVEWHKQNLMGKLRSNNSEDLINSYTKN